MHLEMVKELYSQSKNIVEDSNVKLYKQKKIFTTFNMNSQITATIGFSRTIFIKLQNITLALGNISANIFPKILPPSTTGAWQEPLQISHPSKI